MRILNDLSTYELRVSQISPLIISYLPQFYIRRYFIFSFFRLTPNHYGAMRRAKKRWRDGDKRQPTNVDKENHQIFIEFKWIPIVYVTDNA